MCAAGTSLERLEQGGTMRDGGTGTIPLSSKSGTAGAAWPARPGAGLGRVGPGRGPRGRPASRRSLIGPRVGAGAFFPT